MLRFLSTSYTFFRMDGMVSAPFLKSDSDLNSSVSRPRRYSARSLALTEAESLLFWI